MNTYLVTMQTSDGELVQRKFSVGWDKDKVVEAEVARACAAMVTCEHGWSPGPQGGTMPKRMHVGLTAELLSPEQELAGITDATA